MKKILAAAALVAFALAFAGPVQAQVAADANKGQARVEYDTVFRTSTIVGMTVKNDEGKTLGKINDLVIGLNTGKIRYAALSFGGFAGIGDKLFAIPFHAMTLKYGEKERFFVLSVPVEKFKNAPGFDQSKWPDTANPEWAAGIDKYYSDLKDPANKGEIKVESKEGGAAAAVDVAYRASTIKGLKVKNMSNEDLGNIDELVMDVKAGNVRYAALRFGDTLGFGGKLFAIPWSKFKLHHSEKDTYLVLNVNKEAFKNEHGFDKNNWPNTADRQWQEGIDKHYSAGEPTATKPATKR